jgi:hypothetical protein
MMENRECTGLECFEVGRINLTRQGDNAQNSWFGGECRKVDVEISKLSAFNKRSSHSSSHAQAIPNSLGLEI